MKWTRALVLGVCSLVASAGVAEAVCACGVSSQCAEVSDASAVFVGRVEEHVRSGSEGWTARIAVQEGLRGVVANRVELPVGGECDADLRHGGVYLIFAEVRDGRLVATACSRTAPIAQRRNDLAYIRSLSRPPRDGSLYGFVRLADGNGEHVEAPSAFRVYLQRGGNRREVYRGKTSGDFDVPGLSPGVYRISLQGPVTASTVPDSISITAGSCEYAEIHVKPR